MLQSAAGAARVATTAPYRVEASGCRALYRALRHQQDAGPATQAECVPRIDPRGALCDSGHRRHSHAGDRGEDTVFEWTAPFLLHPWPRFHQPPRKVGRYALVKVSGFREHGFKRPDDAGCPPRVRVSPSQRRCSRSLTMSARGPCRSSSHRRAST